METLTKTIFKNNQKGYYNKDLDIRTLDYYLDLTKHFKSSFDEFVV